MESIERNGVTLEITRGDIAAQPNVEAVVNAANAELRIGGGVAGAIHRGAGPGLTDETRQYAPINPGEAVITGAHDLPNDYVIHCLGPRWGIDHPEAELLANCYENALRLAEENEISSVAFPALSTGAFGYPFEDATDVVFETVFGALDELESVRRIRFVLFSESDRAHYARELAERA